MSIINRRNAILGWAVWKGSKRFAKFKAKRAAKSSGNGGRSKKPLLALSVAGLASERLPSGASTSAAPPSPSASH